MVGNYKEADNISFDDIQALIKVVIDFNVPVFDNGTVVVGVPNKTNDIGLGEDVLQDILETSLVPILGKGNVDGIGIPELHFKDLLEVSEKKRRKKYICKFCSRTVIRFKERKRFN